nr:agenet-like domain, agenet domain [Tanacetum cinerariifolium]
MRIISVLLEITLDLAMRAIGTSLSSLKGKIWCLFDPTPSKWWKTNSYSTYFVKAISLPQDVPSISDRCLIELENEVQCLMEAHLAPKQPIQVNKITSSYEICSGGKWYTLKPEQNNLGDTYNPSWKSHPNLMLGDSEPFDTLADLGTCVNIILLYLFKKLNIRLLEETDHVFGLADGTKSYIGIFRDVEVHIGRLVREGITRSVFGVKGIELGQEEALYWTTIGKRESYKLRTSLDGVGARTPYYARKDFFDCHFPREWEIAKDVKINPFKDILVFKRMVEFLEAIPINLKRNMYAEIFDILDPNVRDNLEDKLGWINKKGKEKKFNIHECVPRHFFYTMDGYQREARDSRQDFEVAEYSIHEQNIRLFGNAGRTNEELFKIMFESSRMMVGIMGFKIESYAIRMDAGSMVCLLLAVGMVYVILLSPTMGIWTVRLLGIWLCTTKENLSHGLLVYGSVSVDEALAFIVWWILLFWLAICTDLISWVLGYVKVCAFLLRYGSIIFGMISKVVYFKNGFWVIVYLEFSCVRIVLEVVTVLMGKTSLSCVYAGSGDWNSTKFQDTANSEKKKEIMGVVFYQMETEEVSDRYVAPCFVNGLEAYDGEINHGAEENMISNEYAVKLCLEHEVKEETKWLRRNSSLHSEAKSTLNRRRKKSNDDWDNLHDFNIDDVSLLVEEGLPPFACKMGKSSHNKKQAMENLNFFYQDIGTSSSAGGHLTHEEAAKEAIAIRMSQKLALLEEKSPIIKTMTYHDKYKKLLDEICKDKVELDGKIVKEEEDAVKRIKGEVLKEKDNIGAFIFPIILEGRVNENALADTGSDINTMPYRIYETLGREDMKKVDSGIMMINHTQAEAIGILMNVLCQVGVTTLIAKFLILDILIDRDSPIVVDVMRNVESDSDDEEDYQIKRNKFGASIYGPKPAPYLNCNDPAERSLAIETVTIPFRKISVWKKAVSFLGSLPVSLMNVNWKPDYKGSYTKEEESIGK